MFYESYDPEQIFLIFINRRKHPKEQFIFVKIPRLNLAYQRDPIVGVQALIYKNAEFCDFFYKGEHERVFICLFIAFLPGIFVSN